jgi:hypothetical protein
VALYSLIFEIADMVFGVRVANPCALRTGIVPSRGFYNLVQPRTSPLHASARRHQYATIMTYNQACRPCARRKVRCDRLEPCSNCKRRKTDRCIYPASTPRDRIRQLESLVQELSHNSNNHRASLRAAQAGSDHNGRVSSTEMRSTEMRSNDPVIMKENGSIQYLES